MTIPYAHTPRPDSGVSNLQLGTWLFLASDAMFMASLLSGYVLLRASVDTVPAIPWSWLRLAVEGSALAGAAFATGRGHAEAWPSARHEAAARVPRDGEPHNVDGEPRNADGGPRNADGGPRFSVAGKRALFVAAALALVCALVQGVALANASVQPRHHVLIASWFVLVGAHIVHLLGGVGATMWVTNRIETDDPGVSVARLGALRLYWTFVLLSWLVITAAFGM